MSITLDTPASSGPPSVKFDNVGDYVTVGIVNVEEYQQRNYDTGEPEVWSDGNPKMGKRSTGLVIDAGNALVGPKGDTRPVETGELVTFHAEGSRHFTWTEAVKAAGSVEVGDVMKWRLDRTEPASNPRYNDRKVYAAVIRKPKAEDGDLADRCVAAYQEMAKRPSLDAGPQPERAAAPTADLDPF